MGLALALGCVHLLAACSQPAPQKRSSPKSASLEATVADGDEDEDSAADEGVDLAATPSRAGYRPTLELADGDSITTLGRLSASVVTATAKSGRGFRVDMRLQKVESIAPFAKFDASTLSAYTVSQDTVWIYKAADRHVGRNKAAPVGGTFEIERVSLAEVMTDESELVVVAAHERHLHFVDASALVVASWSASGIATLRIPYSDGALDEDEHVLGAGAIESGSKVAAHWLVTDARLLWFTLQDARWHSRPLRSGEARKLSLAPTLAGGELELGEAITGLFGPATIQSMVVADEP